MYKKKDRAQLLQIPDTSNNRQGPSILCPFSLPPLHAPPLPPFLWIRAFERLPDRWAAPVIRSSRPQNTKYPHVQIMLKGPKRFFLSPNMEHVPLSTNRKQNTKKEKEKEMLSL
jgi:hypothetical protein